MGGVVAAAVASGAAAAVLVCLLIACRPSASKAADAEEQLAEEERRQGRPRCVDAWPCLPPERCFDAAAVAARTVGFAWSETLGKWPLTELVFGIRRYMSVQGNLQHEYIGSNSIELEGHATLAELLHLLEHLKLCMYFSKRQYAAFLNRGGFSEENVLIHKSNSRLFKPAFTLICDKKSEAFLLFIRGAISTKDRLTAATAAEVPFHHILLHEGRINEVVLGYAHCGMVAAARWIAKHAIPCLLEAIRRFPNFEIKIIGHSMGAGVGSILTYILRERLEFSSCTCIAYAPAACMTWELAESGKSFITSLVNRTDVVPAFSQVSVANLRAEVMLSSRLHDQGSCLTRKLNPQVASIQFQTPSARNQDKQANLSSHYDYSISEPLLVNAGEASGAAANGHSYEHNCMFLQAGGLSVAYAANLRNGIMIQCPTASQRSTATAATNGNALFPEADAHRDIFCSKAFLKTRERESQVSITPDGMLQQSSPGARAPHQFFPPGRIIHMVALPQPEALPGEACLAQDETISIFETSRKLYGKIRLTPNMIKEHYMPSYISTMESLISRLQQSSCYV